MTFIHKVLNQNGFTFIQTLQLTFITRVLHQVLGLQSQRHFLLYNTVFQALCLIMNKTSCPELRGLCSGKHRDEWYFRDVLISLGYFLIVVVVVVLRGKNSAKYSKS